MPRLTLVALRIFGSCSRPDVRSMTDGELHVGVGAASSRPDPTSRYKRLGTGVHAPLGEGSYGVVHAAWDQQNKELVAIKQSPVGSDETVREMLFLKGLPPHPHVIPILDEYVAGDSFCLVFPYRQATLWDIYKRAKGYLNYWETFRYRRSLCLPEGFAGTPRAVDIPCHGPAAADVFGFLSLSPLGGAFRDRTIARYGHHVLLGLAHLHDLDVVHRDVSMSNILYESRSNSMQIADLGLAASATDIAIGRTITTLPFRAPEAILGALSAEINTPQTAVDVWSAGCILASLWIANVLCNGNTWRDVVKMQVCVLGDPRPVWADVVRTPRWAELSEMLPKSCACSGDQNLRFFLQDGEKVRRPLLLPDFQDAVSLLEAMLQWDPQDRITVRDAIARVDWQRVPGHMPSHVPHVQERLNGDRASLAAVPALPVGAGNGAGLSAAPLRSAVSPESEPASDGAGLLAAPSPSAAQPQTGTSAVSGGAGLSAAPLEEERPSVQRCMCSGHCGLSKCNTAKVRRFRRQDSTPICSEPVVSGSLFCELCVCEFAPCASARLRSRWCAGHKRDVDKALEQDGRRYVNQFGLHEPCELWPWEIEAVARHGWFLRFMAPFDLDTFLKMADVIVGSVSELSGHMQLQLWVAMFLKVPSATKAWAVEATAMNLRSRASGTSPTEREYAAAMAAASRNFDFFDTTEGLDADYSIVGDRPETHGSQGLIFGPLTFWRKVGMLHRHVGGDEDADAVTIVYGPKSYTLHMTGTKWNALVEAAARAPPLTLPTTAEETMHFAHGFSEFLVSLPGTFGNGSLNVNPRTDTGYVRKTLVRKLVLWAQRRTPVTIWKETRVSDFRKYTPDKKGFLRTLDQDLMAHELEKFFGVNPWMLSCWACFFGAVPVKHRVFFTGELSTWHCVLQLRSASGRDPSLIQVGKELARKAKALTDKQAARTSTRVAGVLAATSRSREPARSVAAAAVVDTISLAVGPRAHRRQRLRGKTPDSSRSHEAPTADGSTATAGLGPRPEGGERGQKRCRELRGRRSEACDAEEPTGEHRRRRSQFHVKLEDVSTPSELS